MKRDPVKRDHATPCHALLCHALLSELRSDSLNHLVERRENPHPGGFEGGALGGVGAVAAVYQSTERIRYHAALNISRSSVTSVTLRGF